MVTITLHCPHCQSEALVRNGHAPNGKQLYRCRACGRQSRENPTSHAYPTARSEEILHAYQGRVCSKKPTTPGFGLLCAAGRGKWWRMRLGIAVGKTCQRLWEAIPEGYHQGQCFTDLLNVSTCVIPEEQHSAVGPRDGRNRPCRALEYYAMPTSRPFCPHDALVLQVFGDARGVLASVSLSL